ncbi:mechanosensitive ion channel family protein [Reyranella sp. CPCC 100927]|uniref:mechanosensitive ion channel family protein n=1 Tax=Reyranella sp. CPCC 100927 TaxID=2599616 RepID=UPI0015B6349E|nr:mechanosensitive ion channel domain-containing protein [Reyranella sp. CPCC 100927]
MRSLVLALGLLVSMATGTMAQPVPPAPPPGMTQQQFDALVDAISGAVVKKLTEQGTIARKPGATDTTAPAKPSDDGQFRTESRVLADRVQVVLGAFPDLFRHTGIVVDQLNRRTLERAGTLNVFLLLALAVALALGAELVARWALVGAHRGILHGHDAAPGPWRLLGLAAVDMVPILVLAVAARAVGGWWFAGEDTPARLATLLLFGLVAWRSYVLVFRLWFRPSLPVARIVPVNDADARRIYYALSFVTMMTAAVRSWSSFLNGAGTPPDAMSAAAVVHTVVLAVAYIGAIWFVRAPVARWLVAMVEHTHHAGEHIRIALARQWFIFAIALFLAIAAAHFYAVIFARFEVSQAIVRSLGVVIALVLLETLFDYVTRRLAKPAGTTETGIAAPRFIDVAARCLRVLVRIVAFVMVAETWVVEVLALVRPEDMWRVARSGITVGTILFLAYVAWETVQFLADRYAARNPVMAPGGDPEDMENAAPTNVSRLRTLLPVMRIAMAVVIVVLTTLVVLSELGVNIAPLIAGASVIGLAISFGSQALVRDVVSGVFYLADDAFRVGEYLDVGKAKGIVEGFTLRSIRLRHQNGQVHTIPFGQLGQISNFSRDWTTVKFNLRFARNTDFEKVRKAVKKIGQEMMNEPEFKRDMLQPLKMQGVADIADNALVLRFKFTCRPIKPTYIQRQAVKRMFQAFPALGIEFAQTMVNVQALGGGPVDPAVLGGAAAHAQSSATAGAPS